MKTKTTNRDGAETSGLQKIFDCVSTIIRRIGGRYRNERKSRNPAQDRYEYIKKRKIELSPRKKVLIEKVNKIGLLYAERDEKGLLKVGWSLLKSPDEFDRTEGLRLAKERLAYDYQNTLPIHICRRLPRFIECSERYLNGRWVGNRQFACKE